MPISVGIVPKIFSEAKALRKKERKKEKGYSWIRGINLIEKLEIVFYRVVKFVIVPNSVGIVPESLPPTIILSFEFWNSSKNKVENEDYLRIY